MTNLAGGLQCSVRIFSPWIHNCQEVLLCLLGCTTVSILLSPLFLSKPCTDTSTSGHSWSQVTISTMKWPRELICHFDWLIPLRFQNYYQARKFFSGQQIDNLSSFPFLKFFFFIWMRNFEIPRVLYLALKIQITFFSDRGWWGNKYFFSEGCSCVYLLIGCLNFYSTLKKKMGICAVTRKAAWN